MRSICNPESSQRPATPIPYIGIGPKPVDENATSRDLEQSAGAILQTKCPVKSSEKGSDCANFTEQSSSQEQLPSILFTASVGPQ